MMYMLLDFAMWAGVIEVGRNPMELVVIRGATKRQRKPRSLTVEQFQKLNSELKEPFQTIALICVCFGLRISECLALRWSDLDWLKGKLRIERSTVEQHVDDVKTDESRRSLTVASELIERLQGK
jgi:integrase